MLYLRKAYTQTQSPVLNQSLKFLMAGKKSYKIFE